MLAQTLHFSIEGAFITNIAREKFYLEHKLGSAIQILWSATTSDQLTDSEHFMLCLDIISGKKNIVGTYPGDDYGIEENDDASKTSMNDFIQVIDNLQTTIDTKEQDYNDLLQKYLFICDNIDERKLRRINDSYCEAYGEPLFTDMQSNYSDTSLLLIDKYNKNTPSIDSYLSHTKDWREDDYGWLEPNGTYHPVEWGMHSQWARDYADEHYPYKDNASMYWKTDANGKRHHYVCGDFLVYVLGWVLLDNPYQGIATPKHDPSRNLTKAQKEFLYDYYIERGLHDQANAIWED